jgi:hypothetical protein
VLSEYEAQCVEPGVIFPQYVVGAQICGIETKVVGLKERDVGFVEATVHD